VSKRGQGEIYLAGDKARAMQLSPVSRETQERLELFVSLLLLWQEKFNLVSKHSLPLLWTRHISDSLQLIDLAPEALVWADLGSGAGFPGVPIACALAGKPGAQVHLIESVGKKAKFLSEVVRATEIPAVVQHARAEKFAENCAETIHVVTARALSPLKTLCDQSFPLLERGALGIFPKGQDVDAELTEAAKYWTIQSSKVPSKTSPQGCIVLIRGLEPRKRT